MAPRMVEPEREVPGTRESTWNRPDEKCGLIRNLAGSLNREICVLVVILQHNKKYAVDDQGSRYHISVVEMGIHPVVQQKSENCRRNAGHHNLHPELYRSNLLCPCLSRIKRIQPPEVQNNYRQDRPQLDYNPEHGHKRVCHV